METFKERMVTEYNELQERIGKLCTFINGGAIFETLSEDEQSEMKEQLHGMTIYRNALEKRMRRRNLI